MVADNQQPVFIVGVPRSGTTLLAAMLAAHSRLYCGPETRFFHFLAKTNHENLMASWPNNALDFLYSTVLHTIPIPQHYSLNKEDIYNYLIERPPSIANILSSITENTMTRKGKKRWVEKSPEHLLYLQDIRKHFPNSPILQIIRDPRDVALSMIKTSWAPQDFLGALLLWRKYSLESINFINNDRYVKTLYYEQLVESPKREIKKVCAFLGERYESQLLDTTKSAESVVTRPETHKYRVFQPIDKNRIQVWKRELSANQNKAAEAVIGDWLVEHGYELVNKFNYAAEVYPTIDKFLRHRDILNRFVEEDFKFWTSNQEKTDHKMIFVGNPDTDKWLSHSKPERFIDVLKVFIHILRKKLKREDVYWIRDQNRQYTYGYMAKLISQVLEYYEEKI